MPRSLIIVTFYTPGYMKYARLWKAYASRWGVSTYMVTVPDAPTWHDAVINKPRVIHETMERFPDSNVFWCDIDGFIVKDPVLIKNMDETEFDIAAFRYHPPPTKIALKTYAFPDRSWYCTGSVWLNNTMKTRAFVRSWEKDTQKYIASDAGDQDYFNSVLAVTDMNVRNLPVEYCFCLQLMNQNPFAGRYHDAVIIHDFASRESRRKPDGTTKTLHG